MALSRRATQMPTAAVFPGEWTCRPGAGAPWRGEPSWRVVEEASDHLHRDLGQLLVEADGVDLERTMNAQLASFLLALVILEAARHRGMHFSVHAGTDSGDYAALAAAGGVGLADAVRLVATRGAAMQEVASRQTSTGAVVLGAPELSVRRACAIRGDVWPARVVAPDEIAVVGAPEAVRVVTDDARRLGARVRPIPHGVVPSSPLMRSARRRLERPLERTRWRDASVPLISSVDARLHSSARDWTALLGEHMVAPTRWCDSLHTLRRIGVTDLVELGGDSITRAAVRTLPSFNVHAITVPADLDAVADALARRSGARERECTGEVLDTAVRLVVSPAAGVFHAASRAPRTGRWLPVGTLLGSVADRQVRTWCDGVLRDILAVDGERLVQGATVAWLECA